MHLWRYVITVDHGSAPNYGPPSVTLAICKPEIRRLAEVGDLVMAFAGRSLLRGKDGKWHPDAVIWAGEVGEILSFDQYWRDSRFQTKKPDRSSRPDNIYRPRAGGYIQVRNSVHQLGDQSRDIGGRNVLVMKAAWHFGRNGVVLPAKFLKFRIEIGARRGHRRSEIGDTSKRALLAWFRESGVQVPNKRTYPEPRLQSCGCSPRHKLTRTC
ncbi:hypothetical protein ACQR1H_14180 [Bradyrhizobium sp. HKCCYLRH2015]|uniref:Nmad2 family putative nucleotide modification protein n=1 Tax=Bradyrhizobium TaxID=374 RepID=UPI003967382E